jgi:cell division protein FtsW
LGGFFDNLFTTVSDWAVFNEPLTFVLPYYTWLSRLVLPVLAAIIIFRSARSLFSSKADKETWAWLGLGDGMRLAVHHWENIIGRGAMADISLPLPQISRNHAALIRNEKDEWQLFDIAKKGNLQLNGVALEGSALVTEGDTISIAGNNLVFAHITAAEDQEQRSRRNVPGRKIRPFRTLLWLSLFILLLASQLALVQYPAGYSLPVLLGFFWLLALVWLSWVFSRSLRRTGFEIETLAFFLTSLGLAVVSSAAPEQIFKQCLAITIGVGGFFLLGLIMREMRLIKNLRWPIAALALILMAVVLLFGETRYGAQNWITLFNFSLQPSELVKVLFIFAGAATLDRLFARRNLYAFIILSAAIVGSLALMSDFGTAIIFFVTYLVIAFLRSGDLATIGLSLGGAISAVVLVLTAKPYVAERLATWGHAWEFAATGGYQQTRAMTVVSSGGLFGMGGGEGWLKQVAAADTDLVFAFISEEWGLIIAILALSALIIAALFALRSAGNARSSYYVIAACGTASMLLFQTMLNVGGSLDLLPLTGVTFPFVSNGGTSMIACWCLMSFIKAADTRQNASFALSLPSRRKMRKAEAEQARLLSLEELFPQSGQEQKQPDKEESGLQLPDELLRQEDDSQQQSTEQEQKRQQAEAEFLRQISRQKRQNVGQAQAAKPQHHSDSQGKASDEQQRTAEQRLPEQERASEPKAKHSAAAPRAAEEETSPFARPFPGINWQEVKKRDE